MANEYLVTQEGYDKMVEELEELVVVRRAEVAEKLKEARAHGDLSENAEYDAAKDEQVEIEERIVYLEDRVNNAKIINKDEMTDDFVAVGSIVKLKNLDTGEIQTFNIVGTTEADPFAEPYPKVSNESAIGANILNKAKGEVVEIVIPDGLLHLSIEDITR